MDIRIFVVKQGQYDGGPIRFSGTLDEVIASFVAVRTSIPELYRSTAEVEIDSDVNYGSPRAEVTVMYDRPETSEETAARERSESYYRVRKEQEERAQLARLAKKYQAKQEQ